MGIGQAVVATSGNAVDEGTERPEAGRHIGRGQGSQVAEVVQTETVRLPLWSYSCVVLTPSSSVSSSRPLWAAEYLARVLLPSG